jgi:hypothetical protein
MRVKCKLILRFDDPGIAQTVARSLSLDNKGYVAQRVKGMEIHAEVNTESIRELRNTVNDYLTCASVAAEGTRAARACKRNGSP